MANIFEQVDELDKTLRQIQEVVANFETFEVEIGGERPKSQLLTLISKDLAKCDQRILGLLNALQLPTSSFEERRRDPGWDKTAPRKQ